MLLFNYVMCAKICCPTLSQNRTILTMSNLCLKTLQFHAYGIMLVNKKTENVNFKYFRNQIQQIDFGCNFMRENTFYASNSCTLWCRVLRKRFFKMRDVVNGGSTDYREIREGKIPPPPTIFCCFISGYYKHTANFWKFI